MSRLKIDKYQTTQTIKMLEATFRDELRKYLQERTNRLIEIKAEPPKSAYEKWDITSLGDFQFGRILESCTNDAMCMFGTKYDREWTDEEGREMQEIIDSSLIELRDYMKTLTKK